MKNYIKAIVTFVFLMAAAAFMPNVADAAAPAVPTGVHQTNASGSCVEIAWNAVPNASRYYVSWSADGVSNWSEPASYDWTTSPSDIITGLSAGSTYYVRVQCRNSNEEYSGYSEPLQVVTAPDAQQMGKLTLTGATQTSLTISWTPCPGATSYSVYDYSTDALLGTVTDTTFTRTGLAANNSYGIKVIPTKTSAAGYSAVSSYRSLTGIYTKPNKPVTPSTANFGLTSVYYNINVAYLGATDPSKSANGYEIEIYTVKGKKKVFTATSSNYRFTAKRNTPYKYRCRFYASYGDEKIYGDWSGYRYFCFQTVSGKKYSNRIKMSWKKVTGAKSYTVYISTKENGGYKKVKKLSSKKTSITIRKCGKKRIKKNGTYYVKVVANLTDGKKAVKSDTYYVGKTLSY